MPWIRTVLLFVTATLCAQQPQPATTVDKIQAPVQPVPFSHKIHVATGMKCSECHPNSDPGAKMMFPAVAKCMACHNTIAPDKPEIQKLTDFARAEKPVPWVRVYALPTWVSWSHRSHLKAGLGCDGCHGGVAQVDIIAKVTNVTKMAGCVDCHRTRSATLDCGSCHDLGPGN
jgi:hypothetical protein